MTEIPKLMSTLKQQLKAAGISYRQVAEALELSEASIKRLMNSGELSLNRLSQITALCGLQLSELAQLAERQDLQLSSLSREQEAELIADEKRLLVTYLLLNDWQPALIQKDYRFDGPELIRHLAALDRMQLIELLPGNRVRLRTTRDFAWLPDGPIQQYFEQQVREPFFAGEFQPDGFLRFLPAMVSKSSAEKVRERLAKTAREIAELVRADAVQPTEQREGCSVLLAFRGWAFPAFDRYRR